MQKRSDLFRKKSLEQLNETGQLTNHLRVLHPSLLMVMLTLLLMIVGFVVWSEVKSEITNQTFIERLLKQDKKS